MVRQIGVVGAANGVNLPRRKPDTLHPLEGINIGEGDARGTKAGEAAAIVKRHEIRPQLIATGRKGLRIRQHRMHLAHLTAPAFQMIPERFAVHFLHCPQFELIFCESFKRLRYFSKKFPKSPIASSTCSRIQRSA